MVLKMIRKYRYFLAALLMTIVSVLLFNTVFNPYFESNDDNIMAFISQNAYGRRADQLYFVNILAGRIIAGLQSVLINVNCYTMLQYILAVVSVFIIVYWIIRNFHRLGVVISLSFIAGFGFECLVRFQFTKETGMITAAGIILLISDMEFFGKKSLPKAVGAFLIIAGSLFRFSSALMIAGLMSPACIDWLITDHDKKKIRSILIFWGIIASAVFLLKFYDLQYYKSDEAWNRYTTEYQNTYSPLIDFGFPAKLPAGVSGDDISFFKYWNFADPDIFNMQYASALLAERTQQPITFSGIAGMLIKLIWGFMNEITFRTLCAVAALCFALKHKRFRTVLFSAGIAAAFEIYMYYCGRYLLNRVDMVVWLALVLVILYNSTNEPASDCKIAYAALALSVIIMLPNFRTYYANVSKSEGVFVSSEMKDFYQKILSDKKHLYLSDGMTNYMNEAYGMWDVIPEGALSNYYSLGDWLYTSPTSDAVLKSYAVTNPFRDAVNNPDIYFVEGKDVSSVLKYIRRHYAPQAGAVKIGSEAGMTVYRFVSE